MEYNLFDDNALLNDGSEAANNQGINICKERMLYFAAQKQYCDIEQSYLKYDFFCRYPSSGGSDSL